MIKKIISCIALILVVIHTYSQNKYIPNRYFFSVAPSTKQIEKNTLKERLNKKITGIKYFEEISNTGFFVIETSQVNQFEKIKSICNTEGIELKQDEFLPMNCTTPAFIASDAWNDMGYWNSLNQNILKEKQLMDSIYWLVKDNFWNNANDAGETVDFALSEIPNGSHLDLPTINATGTFDYYRNSVVDYANATSHGSQTAGVAFAKINNALGAYNGDMVGMTNIKQPMIKNSGIDANFSSKAAMLSAMQASINETNISGGRQILSISAAITTGIDPDFDLMFNQADANGKVIFVIGAGNDGNPIGTTLSNFHSSVIVVQASDGLGNKAGFSTYNAPLSFRGTGMRGLVLSGTTGTVSWQGTSASAPGAAGATHLLWSLMPFKTAAEIRGIMVDPLNTTTFITNPSATITPALRTGYLIQNLHFDIVHDYSNPINLAYTPTINLTTSTHDIQGGTITNPTYFYQKNQTGAWIAATGGIISTAILGVGKHNVKLRFDILHRTGLCTEIVRSIVINNVAITPVRLINFTANAINCKNSSLQWQTTQEQNNNGFDIEQSNNGIDFYKVGHKVAVTNNSNINTYYYTIAQMNEGEIFYRLKQLDNDGKFTYSTIVSVNANCNTNNISLSPNPADNQISIKGLNVLKPHTIQIFDNKGALVKTLNGIPTNPIAITELSKGVYLLKIDDNESLKFIKQ